MTNTIRAHLEKAMRKLPKNDPKVQYSDTRGMPNHHCGAAGGNWQEGYCRHFWAPDACQKVSGVISPKGGCDLWQKARS